MKKLKRLLLSVIASVCFLGWTLPGNEGELVVIPGQGFGNVRVGVTTMEEIKTEYGKSKVKRHKGKGVACFGGKGECQWFYTLTYKVNDKGLEFRSGRRDKGSKKEFILEKITINLPARARTPEGITLGESTVADVERVYGKPVFITNLYDNGLLAFSYDGIGFVIRNDQGYKENFEDITKASKVIGMSIEPLRDRESY